MRSLAGRRLKKVWHRKQHLRDETKKKKKPGEQERKSCRDNWRKRNLGGASGKDGEGNGTHSSTLAWKIPWTEGPGGLQSMGSLGVGHDWATSLYFFTFMHWRRKWQPTPVFLPGESQGRGAWWAAVYGVAQSRTQLKRLSSSSSSSIVTTAQLYSSHMLVN